LTPIDTEGEAGVEVVGGVKIGRVTSCMRPEEGFIVVAMTLWQVRRARLHFQSAKDVKWGAPPPVFLRARSSP